MNTFGLVKPVAVIDHTELKKGPPPKSKVVEPTAGDDGEVPAPDVDDDQELDENQGPAWFDLVEHDEANVEEDESVEGRASEVFVRERHSLMASEGPQEPEVMPFDFNTTFSTIDNDKSLSPDR